MKADKETLQAQLKQARKEIRLLRLFLDLAVRYLGRAVADDLMSNCVVHPRDALRRIEAGMRELDKKKEKTV